VRRNPLRARRRWEPTCPRCARPLQARNHDVPSTWPAASADVRADPRHPRARVNVLGTLRGPPSEAVRQLGGAGFAPGSSNNQPSDRRVRSARRRFTGPPGPLFAPTKCR